jgi:uncharacterized protein with HEPN domain
MKHPERVDDYLDHIAQAIQRATEYIEGVGSLAAVQQSGAIKTPPSAISRSSARPPTEFKGDTPEFVAAHPELPWVEMRGMRNKVIHNYFEVNLSVVWNTVKDDLPRLKQQIDHLMNEQQPTLAQRFGRAATHEAQPEQDHEPADELELLLAPWHVLPQDFVDARLPTAALLPERFQHVLVKPQGLVDLLIRFRRPATAAAH